MDSQASSAMSIRALVINESMFDSSQQGLEVQSRIPRYAALICSVGYETRSSFIPRLLQERCEQIWAYGFETHRVIKFAENRSWVEAHGIYFEEPEPAYQKHLSTQVYQLVESWTKEVESGSSPAEALRLAVDISSMSRERLAKTILAVLDERVLTALDDGLTMEVDWFYAPAKFSSEELTEDGPVSVNRAIAGFEGWTDDPTKPAVCILGTGLEGDLALGAIERLEPAETWGFTPKGYDTEYDAEFDRKNARLISSLDEGHLIQYAVDQPFAAILQLDALVERLRSDYRVVIVPLGPKIFALASLLLAQVFEDLTIWRLSADYNRVPHDRVATGPIVGLRTVRGFQHHTHLWGDFGLRILSYVLSIAGVP